MISIRLGKAPAAQAVLVCPVTSGTQGAPLGVLAVELADELGAEVAAYLTEIEHKGKAGALNVLPRPLRQPGKVLLLGVGSGDEAGWRQAGAALARAGAREAELIVRAPADLDDRALRGFAEGLWLGAYRYRLRSEKPEDQPKLAQVWLDVEATAERERVLAEARTLAAKANFARDLTNTPSLTKNPAWFVDQVRSQTGSSALGFEVWEPERLAAEGFGGILAVGSASDSKPRLLQLSWSPEGATKHVVLVGKGITFDTGGVDIKPTDGMQLMRKDMAGAAAVIAATLAVAELDLPVRVTALAPLAENMLSGGAWRSGDVVRHYGGLTSEVHSTDAEGRVVLADALAYADAHLDPDVVIDLATLTGASRVALGKKVAALFSESDELAAELEAAAGVAGEQVWRMPLAEEYMSEVVAEIADLNNAAGNPGAITAALYLREFAGGRRGNWAHIDMSAPSWSGSDDAELSRGATGWGVRTLVRWLQGMCAV